MQKLLVRAFSLWLPFAVSLTGIFGFCYLAVQQNYRQSMNDPQIQMAEDAALQLSQGRTPADVVLAVPFIDMRQSIAPWIVVYDAVGVPVESSVTLDEIPPRMPEGLLDTNTWVPAKMWRAPSGPETRVSWQPRRDVREALVLVQYQTRQETGWVAVGRSMRPGEENIMNLTKLAALAWSATVLATFATIFLLLILGWL